MAKKRKGQLASLLVVGEGACDKAFIKHMNRLYSSPHTGQKVKVDSGDGGSPASVIQTTIRKYKHVAYDRRFILLDSDIPIRQQDFDKAKSAKIELIISSPICLEGMLLDVLDQPIPCSNRACKDCLHAQLVGSPVSALSYAELFPKPLLDATLKEQIIRLRRIIMNE